MLPVDILRPKSLPELWKLLKGSPKPRRFLAGGTDLVLEQKRSGLRAPGTPPVSTWIDLSDLAELKGIRTGPKGLTIGSNATYGELEGSRQVSKDAPALSAVCPEFASPPIRNRATLGGNCANASPAGDGLPALYAEEAKLVLERYGKRREVPVEDFFLGPRKTVLREDELLVAVRIPRWNHRGTFLKLGPRDGFCISKAAAAVALETKGGKVAKVRIALGAVGPTVLRAVKTEEFLSGKVLSDETLRVAQALASSESRPITDHRSTAEYRRAMAGVLVRRALERLRGPSEKTS